MVDLKNYMEQVVFSFMYDVLDDDMCKCDKCIMDIAALALNELPCKYVVTNEGELFSKVNLLKQQFEVDVISAITKASEIVKNNPHH